MANPWRLVIVELRAFALAALIVPCPSYGKEPVSYGREVAPILALHCYGCHGESNPSSGYQVSTYQGLLRGGFMGDDVTPGQPDRSVLLKFIEGFRGPEQRMPLGARPLTVEQIHLIRQWIAEGARNDNAGTPCWRLSAAATFVSGRPLHISCKVTTPADLILSICDGQNDLLHREEASVKVEQETMDAGATNRPLRWTIHQEKGWPANVTVEVVIRYAPKGARAELKAESGKSAPAVVRKLIAGECLPD